MTRETKIGLLVGLAFIIVIGILLSDHLTSSTEPPPATLANAGNNVRQTVTTPGGNNGQPTVTNVAMNPQQQVAPGQPVPTPGELQPRPQPVQIVQVGGPNAQPQAELQMQPQLQPQPQPQPQPMPVSVGVADQTGPRVVTAAQPDQSYDAPIITQVPVSNVSDSLAQAARQQGETLVPVDASGRAVQSSLKEYKAEPGDNLSRMAMMLLGANTRANRDAIVRANPSLQQDPNKVIVGRKYLIPTSGVADTGSSVVAVVDSQQQESQSQQMQRSPVQLTSATEYWYTVKENDSLWRIASEQLGSANSIAAIKELNKDALKGEDTVYVGMKLKLPGKPMAKAN